MPRSTYSSSLPIGTPRASRVTRTPRDRSASPSTCAVASPSAVKLVARITSSTTTVAGAVEQLAGADLERADAVERAEPAHQHEVEAAIAAGALERRLVGRRLDHRELAPVARRVEADAADRLLGEGVAALAVAHPRDRLLQRLGDPPRAVAVVLQQVPGHPLRRLDADARKATQRLDQAFERGFSGQLS